MDTGAIIRPVQTAPVAAVRQEAPVDRQVARTELPPTQSVQAIAENDGVEVERNPQRNLIADLNAAIDNRRPEPKRSVSRDEATQELVFRTVSPETGQVVSQFPDEAMLRQRAYVAQQRRAELEAESALRRA